ncbi:MAG: lamin tail domain-containing protein [Verrucomicrobia bacterium]|nr:lamin tail domain-containing protein [Verrucomicrobiota bacterium]
MQNLKRDRKALVVLIVLFGFAFWNRETLWRGYTSLLDSRRETRRPQGRRERNPLPPPAFIPDLPKVALDTNQVRLELTAINSVPDKYDSKVRISEIFYHATAGNEALEFVELANFTGTTVSMSGLRFVEGIQFQFPPGTLLIHGECLVVCQNETALRAAFGAEVKIAGTFQGGLKNSGELLRLENDRQETVLEQIFGDAEPWRIAPKELLPWLGG